MSYDHPVFDEPVFEKIFPGPKPSAYFRASNDPHRIRLSLAEDFQWIIKKITKSNEICKEEISPLLNQHSQLQSNLEWDGIRKQICATTTFYLSEESTQNLMTVSGGPMEVELDRIKNKILSNQTTIRDIVSAPCQNKEKKQSCLTSGATLGDILKAQGIDLMTMISDK